MIIIIKRYKFALSLFMLNIVLLIIVPDKGLDAFKITGNNILMLTGLIPPIFILLGLLDIWIPREKLTRHMGPDSGIKGALLSYVLGSSAAGPLYVAFPIATMLLKKGASLTNIFIFLGAWSTTKLPMILFEASSLGLKYTIFRLFFNSIGIIVIAFVLNKTTSQSQEDQLYNKATQEVVQHKQLSS